MHALIPHATPLHPLAGFRGHVPRLTRKILIGVAGFSVLALSAVLFVLPGSSLLFGPLGLEILAPEFPWARRLLQGAQHAMSRFAPHFQHHASRARQPDRHP